MDDFIIERGVLKKYTGPGGDVVIPYGVMSIGHSAFYNCEKITSITFPQGVKFIGPDAFAMCSGLANITLPKQLTILYENAFYGCTGLKSATILGKVTCFKDGVFEECPALETIISPEIPVNFWRTKDLGRVRRWDWAKTRYAYMALLGYMLYPEQYKNRSVASEYRNCILTMAEGWEIRSMIFQQDRADLLAWYTQHGAITAINFDRDYFQPAMEANATACTALLLRWRDEHLCTNQIDRMFEL